MNRGRGHRVGTAGLLLAVTALAACQMPERPASPELQARADVEVAPEPGWRTIAAPGDVARLDSVTGAWRQALERARPRFRQQIEAEGRLLDPLGALPRPTPGVGAYRCRMIRFGGEDGRAFETFQPFFCHVTGDDDSLSIIKQGGSERPSGYLWEDRYPRRLIFLGSRALGDDDAPLAYGEDDERDMAGVFERVGPLRFRLVVPRPRWGSTLEIIELTPAPNQPAE